MDTNKSQLERGGVKEREPGAQDAAESAGTGQGCPPTPPQPPSLPSRKSRLGGFFFTVSPTSPKNSVKKKIWRKGGEGGRGKREKNRFAPLARGGGGNQVG